MSNLTKYQENQIAEIVEDAIAVTPTHYQSHLAKSFQYLAFLAIKEQCDWHLADIQLLIDTAKANNAAAVVVMTQKLDAEISQLQGEMRSGFEKVADVLRVIDDRQNAIEQRVDRLEQQPQPTVIINNSHHGAIPKELLIIAALTTLVGLLVLQQSMNVRDTWYLQNKQEVQQ